MFRYPGSKAKQVNYLANFFPNYKFSLVEPFCGTAALSLYMIKENRVSDVTLSDADFGVASFWTMVKDNPLELEHFINTYIPSVDDFYALKSSIPKSMEDAAFRHLVLHQTSYSGLGAMAGGPIGGKLQKSKYTVDCRWSPKTLIKNLRTNNLLLNKVEVTIEHADVFHMLNTHPTKLFYLDPPYYVKGKELYFLGEFNHLRLRDYLNERDGWVLSYDDVPEIRELYGKNTVHSVAVISHLKHASISDVVILP